MKTTANDYNFKIIVITSIALFVYKFFQTTNYLAILLNSLMELSVFIIFFALFKFLVKDSKKTKKVLAGCIYYPLFTINSFLFFLTSYFFSDTLMAKYSFLSFNTKYFSFVSKSIINPVLALLWIFGIIALFIVPLIDIKFLEKLEFDIKWIFYPAIIFLIAVPLIQPASANNIYGSTVLEASRMPLRENIQVSSSDVDKINVSKEEIETGIDEYSNYSLGNNEKVLVFVMEQVSIQDFNENLKEIPKEENFFTRVKDDSHIYTNYFTKNQDSLGSLWSLMYSAPIPFESYINNWQEKFGYVLSNRNTVDLFNHHNYTTVAAASMYESNLVLGAFPWDKNIFLQEYPVKNHTCIDSMEYQSGCEDAAILKRVKESILEDSGTFLFQEFIFGHGQDYLEKSGKNRTEYYNRYLNNMYDFLEKENMSENTTIVVVADHGDKGYFSKDIYNYNIPLIVVNSDLDYKEIDKLYSHPDFNDILFSYLDDDRDIPKEREEIHIVGQTASSELAYINSKSEHFIAKNTYEDDYSYESNSLDPETIKNKISYILSQQEPYTKLSSKKDYYCRLCETNREDIKSQRHD